MSGLPCGFVYGSTGRPCNAPESVHSGPYLERGGHPYQQPYDRRVADRRADTRLAVAVLYWYDTTHGNEFGHDHHCPTGAAYAANPHQLQPDDRCTCGWSGVLAAEQARVAARG